MSTSIDTSFIRQYERDVHEVFQLKGSVLKPGVRMKTDVVGESTTFQKVGKGVATTKARHGTITPMNQTHTAIVCTLADFYAGDWVDRLDEAKTNIDERKIIADGGAMALGRKVDEQIFTQLDATTQTTVTWVVTSAAAIRNSMTAMVGDLIANASYEVGMLYGVLSPVAWEMAMTVKEFQSADFVGPDGMEFKRNAPFAGVFKFWNGVLWTVHPDNPDVGTSASKVFVWNKRAIGYATGKHAANLAGTSGRETAVGADITWHGDRAAHFVNHAMSGGGCLIDDTGVIEGQLDDTATPPVT